MKHLLLLFVLCLSFYATAQERHWKRDPNDKGPFIWDGELNFLCLQVRGLPGHRNLGGADVIIMSRKDTITLESSPRGIVSCDALLADSVWVKVSCAGYEPLEGKIKSRSGYEIYLNKKKTETPTVGSVGAEVKDAVQLQPDGAPASH